MNQTVVAQAEVWQVFVLRDVDETGIDRLIFVDTLTGDEITVEAYGERYTPAGDVVLFFDAAAQRVRTASPDGILRDHPFIQSVSDTRRIDWIVSADNTLIAWTLTNGSSSSQLTTLTTVANLDGSLPRPLLLDGPRDGIRALPIAFSIDNSALYMDYQPDSIGELTPFAQYAGIFSVSIPLGATEAEGEPTFLPDEPGCFCGAGLGAGWFLRLVVTSDLSGFDIRAYNLIGEVETTIPALSVGIFAEQGFLRMAGDVLISPDGRRAVYSLAQVEGFGTPNQSVQSVLALVNLELMRQDILSEPITTFVHPVEWTEDNSAVIFTAPDRSGTWKINLSDGVITNVASSTYIGTVSSQ